MNFAVGQKVVCIDDWAPTRALYPDVFFPTKGQVYTVRETENRGELPAIRLHEIVNAPRPHRGWLIEPSFASESFRPVIERKTDISVFQKLLLPVKERERV